MFLLHVVVIVINVFVPSVPENINILLEEYDVKQLEPPLQLSNNSIISIELLLT